MSRRKKKKISEWNVSYLSPHTYLELNERRLEKKISRNVISTSQFGTERAESLNRQLGEIEETSRGEESWAPSRRPHRGWRSSRHAFQGFHAAFRNEPKPLRSPHLCAGWRGPWSGVSNLFQEKEHSPDLSFTCPCNPKTSVM